jgi:bifunctional UDP-N-acetylglucosamine pyrophosphorylase/glucosamine-1-phosphate N-acetyltransferase
VIVDARYAAVSADTLRRLAGALPTGLCARTLNGRIVAAALPPGPADMPLGVALTTTHPLGEIVVEANEAFEVDDPWGLAEIERRIRLRVAADHVRAGVRVVDPWRVVIEGTVTIAPGAVIWPDVVLRGLTSVAAHAEVFPGCYIVDTQIGPGARVHPHSVCEGAVIGAGAEVGPMARLRPAAVLGDHAKVGNFVEVKKSTLRAGAKASHLAYIGDADVGEGANIGAGTITCNYDGHRKHRTKIGAGVFVGSNSSLVAPVEIGANAVIGAGSVISADVPEGALAVERAETRVLPGKGRDLMARNRVLAERERGPR